MSDKLTINDESNNVVINNVNQNIIITTDGVDNEVSVTQSSTNVVIVNESTPNITIVEKNVEESYNDQITVNESTIEASIVSVIPPDPPVIVVNIPGLQGPPGPQGPQGPQGNAGDLDVGSIVTTSSFNAFTSSYTTGSFTGSFIGTFIGTSSWATNYTETDPIFVAKSASLATTGSNIFIGNQTVTGSLFTTGSNTLVGNTILSGTLRIQGQYPPSAGSESVSIVGNVDLNGYLRFDPVTSNINNSISASYIYVSGSTNDLYFSQNGAGYYNTTRLRWLEGNLYTGLLHGGVITQVNSNTYQVGSGSGIIVNLNTSFDKDPYPTIQFLEWGNLTRTIDVLSGSFDQQFVAVSSSANIAVIKAQGTPYNDGDYNTSIPIGIVIHQNRSTINAVQTFPGVAYGWKQRSFDFIKAFGPLKISGYTLAASGSSTGSLVLSGGTAWVDGRNYIVDPKNPSYIVEATGITTSKIYRYYQSGSNWQSNWGYNTNGGAGYATIDPTQYSNNGTLTSVSTNHWTIQRVFYFPNSTTKAFYIYYGNAQYANESDALAAVTTEPFTEAPNTAANAIYIGFMLLRHNANFTVPASHTFYAGGLFRGSGTGGGGGGGGSTALSGLTDVLLSSLADGDLLRYNSSTGLWNNSKQLSGSYNVIGSLNVSNSLDTANRYLINSAGNTTLDWEFSILYDINGAPFIDGFGRNILNTAGNTLIDTTALTLSDNNTSASLTWDSNQRYLYDNNNNIALQWNNTGSSNGVRLFGTASYAQSSSNAVSSSYAVTASFANQADSALNAASANLATDAYGVYVTNLIYTNGAPPAPEVPLPLLTTQRQGGYTSDGYTPLYENSNVLLTNSNVLTITGSGAQLRIGYEAPNPLGIPALPFYGTVQIFGNVYANSYTGSLQGTSSYANSASYTISASFATTSSYALSASLAISSSRAISSSYSVTSSFATSASYSLSASYAVSASFSRTAVTASNLTAGTYLITSSWANTASYADAQLMGNYSAIESISKLYPILVSPFDTTMGLGYGAPYGNTDLVFNPRTNTLYHTGSDARVFIGAPGTTGARVVVYGKVSALDFNNSVNTLNFVTDIDREDSVVAALSVRSGSLFLSGSSYSGSFTGSLFGTSSWAQSSSNAISSSYALTASLAPAYVLNSDTASMLAPYLLTAQTSSFVTNTQTSSMTVLSSSYSITASHALNVTSGVSETLAIAYAIALG